VKIVWRNCPDCGVRLMHYGYSMHRQTCLTASPGSRVFYARNRRWPITVAEFHEARRLNTRRRKR